MGIIRSGKTRHKATLELGKVDGYGNGRQSCPATIEVTLRERVYFQDLQDTSPKNGQVLGIELSVRGNIYNQRKTDIIKDGQCIDTLKKLLSKNQKTETVKKVLDIWDNYQLSATYHNKDHINHLPQNVVNFVYTL